MQNKNSQSEHTNGNSPRTHAQEVQNRAELEAAIDQRLQDQEWSRQMAARVVALAKTQQSGTQGPAGNTNHSKLQSWKGWLSAAAAAIIAAVLIGVFNFSNPSPGSVQDNRVAEILRPVEQDLMLIETESDQEIEAMLAGAVFVP